MKLTCVLLVLINRYTENNNRYIDGAPVEPHLAYRGLVHVRKSDSATPTSPASSSRCTGMMDRPGRWVYVGPPGGGGNVGHGQDQKKAGTCPRPFCSSSVIAPDNNLDYWRTFSDDEMGYSRGYVWTPWE